MPDRSKRPPGEALVDLRRRLALLSARDPARTEVIARAAEAYGVSVWRIYRAIRELTRPKSVRRSDHGATRALPAAGMERYTEIVAALKIRTSNILRMDLLAAGTAECVKLELRRLVGRADPGIPDPHPAPLFSKPVQSVAFRKHYRSK